MTSSDEAFLAEVDRFLTSCDSPLSSVKHILADRKIYEWVPEPEPRFKINRKLSSVTKTNAEVLTKRELERAKDRQRRKVYRARRRLERVQLQHQVKVLSDKLCGLHKEKEQKLSLSASTWKTIAMQRLEELQVAELQQQRLQEAVLTRTRLIEEFAGFLHEGLHKKEILLDHSHCQHKRVQLGSSDVFIFETYLLELDTVYAQTDHVFQKYKMTSSLLQQTWTFDNRTGYFEFADKLEIPVDFNRTSQFLWHLSHVLHRQEDRELYDGVNDPINTIALKYRIKMRLNCGQCVSAVQSIVGRRYNEKDRVVVIWRSFTEGEGPFRGMHSDETGWCIAESSATSEKTGTSLTTCIRHKPLHINSAEHDERIVEQFTGLVHTTGSEDFAEITSSLKKMLSENEKSS